MRSPRSVLMLACLLVLGACSSSATEGDGADGEVTTASDSTTETSRPRNPPPDLEGLPDELDPETVRSVEVLIDMIGYETPSSALHQIDGTGDVRLAWVVTDALRFTGNPDVADRLYQSIETLTGNAVDPDDPWRSAVDGLMLDDIPAPPGYFGMKRDIYVNFEDRWAPFFAEEGSIDWRLVSWGGVRPDDRPLGDPNPCPFGCIPALDDPAVTPASGGSWYGDQAIVFGVVVDGEARAYPKHIMEVHEMVNDTLGGRRIGVPYCTLCGSAQAYFTDDAVPDRDLVLRTSGLLIRSNKMMFELESMSLVDTFTGQATSGPLLASGVELEQISVVTSTWGEWKAAHPDTTIVAQDGGLGRTYPDDPLRGRDDDGPIFPIGEVDDRLGVQEPVLGVVSAEGVAVAFPVEAARQAIEDGEPVELEGFGVVADGGGIRAVGPDGGEVGSHQAFWFAWSQFHPGTLLWS